MHTATPRPNKDDSEYESDDTLTRDPEITRKPYIFTPQ